MHHVVHFALNIKPMIGGNCHVRYKVQAKRVYGVRELCELLVMIAVKFPVIRM